jgi:hypothetical protein
VRLLNRLAEHVMAVLAAADRAAATYAPHYTIHVFAGAILLFTSIICRFNLPQQWMPDQSSGGTSSLSKTFFTGDGKNT